MPPAELERRVIVEQPENSETPLSELRGWVTPNRLFFVRNHFDVPSIDRRTWRLRVTGCVRRELDLDWPAIDAMATRSVFATMECAGNGRSFLEQTTHGVQWGAGAVGHAEWVGPSLRTLLDQAGVTPEAREVIFTGVDRGTEPDHPQTMAFARSLPLEKALHEDTLLAVEMNGEPLTEAHGSPLRLIAPGWYGVASVKWLERIHVTDKVFNGYYQTTKYTVTRRTGRGPTTEVVGEMLPKSEILRPQAGEQCGVGLHSIVGVAWAGPDAVSAVEITTDGGRNWALAELTGIRAPYSWTLWQYAWRPTQPGPCRLMSRAISESGRMQPLRHDPLCGGYLIHYSRPIDVEVAPTWGADSADYTSGAAKRAFDQAAEDRSQMNLDVEMRFGDGGGI